MKVPAHFPDPFAVEWGHDEFGTFQSFAVENVVQRMRWIPPGRFMMGSPKSEVGRHEDELQHYVQLTNGFWLADTPVTQELWQIVMGTHPSQFKAATDPVNPVSWEDCQTFLQQLNQRIVTLDTRLPTEAEWEYACRAGTTTATWVGDPQGELEPWAARLDTIAWYGVNAGRKPHEVAQKGANPWGLFDMLGNVWEWCADWFGPYDAGVTQDPRGPRRGVKRIMRGGSWHSPAFRMRAATRDASYPANRIDRIGFRLARSATPKYPIER